VVVTTGTSGVIVLRIRVVARRRVGPFRRPGRMPQTDAQARDSRRRESDRSAKNRDKDARLRPQQPECDRTERHVAPKMPREDVRMQGSLPRRWPKPPRRGVLKLMVGLSCWRVPLQRPNTSMASNVGVWVQLPPPEPVSAGSVARVARWPPAHRARGPGGARGLRPSDSDPAARGPLCSNCARTTEHHRFLSARSGNITVGHGGFVWPFVSDDAR
jgi:hypothetical protein